jgi:hypothetical protein
MTRVFKAAHDQGLDKDINTPYKSRLDRQQANAAMKARAANPLKQANEPPAETPAAPEQKPRVRVKAVSRPSEPQTNKITRRQFSSLLKNNPNMKVKSGLGEDGVPTNTVGSGNIAGFSPILGPILRRKRKTGNS